jgi:hypothetical protein
MQLGGSADVSRPFVWSRASGLMRFRAGYDTGTASNFLQILQKVRRRPCQWLDKRSGKRQWAVHRKSILTETKEGERDEEQSQEHTHQFLSFIMNSSWQANKSILHTTVTFYGDWVKMCPDFVPNFGDKRTGSCITAAHRVTLSHFFFHQGIFDQKQYPSCFSLFPR